MLEHQHQTSDAELEQELEIYVDESGSHAECWSTAGEMSVREAISENEVPVKYELVEGFSESSAAAPVVHDAREIPLSQPHGTDDCVVVTNEDFVFDASSNFKSVETASKSDWKKKLLAKTAVASMFGGLRASSLVASGPDGSIAATAAANGGLTMPNTVTWVGQETVADTARQPVLIEESRAAAAVSAVYQVSTKAQSHVQLNQTQASAEQTNQVVLSPAVDVAGKGSCNAEDFTGRRIHVSLLGVISFIWHCVHFTGRRIHVSRLGVSFSYGIA